MIRIRTTSSLVAPVLVCCCTLGLLVGATKYSVCDQGKTYSEVKNVTISGCEALNETCPFVRGFNKSIGLDFVPTDPDKRFEQVKVKVMAKFSGVPFSFLIDPDNACGNYGFDCPLEAGDLYGFKMSLPVWRTLPKINIDFVIRLIDESGNVISCIETPARIQEPQKAQNK